MAIRVRSPQRHETCQKEEVVREGEKRKEEKKSEKRGTKREKENKGCRAQMEDDEKSSILGMYFCSVLMQFHMIFRR